MAAYPVSNSHSLHRGDYEEGKWNEEYWKLKEEFVGVVPPVERTEADLDPPTIFHIAQDYDMIRWAVRSKPVQLESQIAKSGTRLEVARAYLVTFVNVIHAIIPTRG